MKALSLKGRLLIGLLVSLTMVLAAGCAGLYWLQRKLLTGEFDRQLSRQSMMALWTMRPAGEGEEPRELPGELVFAAVLDPDGGTLERQVQADAGLQLDLSAIALPDSEAPAFSVVRLADGREVRVVAWRMWSRPFPWRARRGDRRQPATQPAETQPAAAQPEPLDEPDDRPDGGRRDGPDGRRGEGPARVMLAGADLAPLQASLRQWLLMLLAGGAAGEVLVAIVVLLAVRQGLKPLRVLEADIASVDDSDLHHRLAVRKLPREVVPIVRQLNALLDRLEAAFERERAFTASAAHEFRTPLAGIRTQLEVALRRPREPESYQQTLRDCLGAALALQEMVDVLLDLARLDAGQVQPSADEVSAAALVARQWERLEPTARVRGCWLRADVPASLSLCTDPMMLDRIVANLLANAAEYADVNTEIHLSARQTSDGLCLSVENQASDLSPHDVERMFDRFWRHDSARHAGQHCGLGLAIVQRCAQALGGQAGASLHDGRLRLTVQLPALPTPGGSDSPPANERHHPQPETPPCQAP